MEYSYKKKAQEAVINSLLFLFILTNFLVPKFNIFTLEGFNQGIRFENILTLFMLIFFIVSKKYIFNNKQLTIFNPFLYFIIISFVSNYLAFLNGQQIEIVYLLRIIEYFIFFVVLYNSSFNSRYLVNIIKYFFIINFIGITFQYFGLMGSFKSSGYDPNILSTYHGFFSGNWELAFMAVVSFFMILCICKNDTKKIIIYLILTLIILYITRNRGTTFAFLVSLFCFLFFKDKLMNFKIFIILLVTTLLIFVFLEMGAANLQHLENYDDIKYVGANILDNLVSLDIFYIYGLLKDFFIYGNVIHIDDTPNEYLSLYYRLVWWDLARSAFLENIFSILFGGGNEFIYYESLIFRIIFTTGIIGTLILLFLMFRLVPIFLIVFFITSGLTIDFIASYKLTVATILLSYVYSKYYKKVAK